MNFDGKEMIRLDQRPGGHMVDGLIFLPSTDNKCLRIMASYIDAVKPGASFYVGIDDEGLHVASFPPETIVHHKIAGQK